MTGTSTSASMTHAFDPAEWLGKFQSIGGGYVLADSRFSLMYQIEGSPADDQRSASRMIGDLTSEDRASLIAHLRARSVGVA